MEKHFNNRTYAVTHIEPDSACGSKVLSLFSVVRFRAASAKTNNDRKKSTTYAVGVFAFGSPSMPLGNRGT
jgi:hypothetical protein